MTRKPIIGFIRLLTAVTCLLAIGIGHVAGGGVLESQMPGQVINIVQWDANRLPPVYERSDQLPLTPGDVEALTRSGFTAEALARMIQERRFAGDASAAGLIELADRGIDPAVVQAISLHALPPNQSIRITVDLQFEGTSGEARKRYLYVIVPDGERERVLTADLGSVIGGRWQRDATIDHSDPVLPRQVRSVSFTDELPLKVPGPRDVIVLTSARPNIRRSRDIPSSERADLRRFSMNYPATSVARDCRVWIRYRQDPALPYKWDMTAADLECEWN